MLNLRVQTVYRKVSRAEHLAQVVTLLTIRETSTSNLFRGTSSSHHWFCTFLSTFRIMSRSYLEIGHGRFLPSTFFDLSLNYFLSWHNIVKYSLTLIFNNCLHVECYWIHLRNWCRHCVSCVYASCLIFTFSVSRHSAHVSCFVFSLNTRFVHLCGEPHQLDVLVVTTPSAGLGMRFWMCAGAAVPRELRVSSHKTVKSRLQTTNCKI
jgi:hypothetical protein